MEWGKFRLGDLFEIKSSKKIYHANEIDYIFDEQVKNSFPYVVRTTQNNGIRGYIIEDIDFLNDENTLSFAQDTFSVFYQKQRYFTGNKVKVLQAKFENNTEKIMQYLTACFQKALNTFTWGIGSTVESIVKIEISLPTKNGKIDFDFMESFIAELEAEKIAELNNYLEITGLKDYNLTSEEEKVLEDFESGKFEWGEFRIGELFEIKHYGKQRSQNDLQKDGDLKYNFVMQNENNNGIIEKVPEQIGNDFNLIPGNSISAFTHLNKVYYQEEPFYSKQGSNVYTLRNNFLNKKRAKFIISSINSIIGELEYGKNTASRLIDYIIQLPKKGSEPDFELMEVFVGAVQKMVVRDLVEYVEERV